MGIVIFSSCSGSIWLPHLLNHQNNVFFLPYFKVISFTHSIQRVSWFCTFCYAEVLSFNPSYIQDQWVEHSHNDFLKGGGVVSPMPNFQSFLDLLAFKKVHVSESSTLCPWYWFNIFRCSLCTHVSTPCPFSMRYHTLILVSLSIYLLLYCPPPQWPGIRLISTCYASLKEVYFEKSSEVTLQDVNS